MLAGLAEQAATAALNKMLNLGGDAGKPGPGLQARPGGTQTVQVMHTTLPQPRQALTRAQAGLYQGTTTEYKQKGSQWAQCTPRPTATVMATVRRARRRALTLAKAKHKPVTHTAHHTDPTQSGGTDADCGAEVVTSRKKPRAPSYDEHMAARQARLEGQQGTVRARGFQGPVVDTAAKVSIVNWKDKHRLEGVYTLAEPIAVKGATGSTQVTKAGSWDVGPVRLDKVLVVDQAPQSVVATQDLLRPDIHTGEGYTLVMDSKAAGLVKGDIVVEIVPQGTGFFTLPTMTKTAAIGVQVQRAIAKMKQAVSERCQREWISHLKHAHMPRRPDCGDCQQAKMRAKEGVACPSQPQQQLEVGFDLVGPLPESPESDGNVYKLVGVCATTGVGWSAGLVNKQAGTVLLGVKAVLARIRLLHKHNDDVTVRFHSDKDKSFLGEVKTYAEDKAWLRTTTEGYASNANTKVETRNRRLQQTHRACLLSATGGRLQYEELWDTTMEHAGDIVNQMPEAGKATPVYRAGGEDLTVDDAMECYGAKAWYYEASERRQTRTKQNDTSGRLGIWLGRSQAISGGHRVAPIEWSTTRQQWLIGATIDRAYAEVDNTEYPLRQVPAKGLDPTKLANFVDRMAPEAMVPNVYVVEKVLDMRGAKN